jgi:PilZ domain-containing protein
MQPRYRPRIGVRCPVVVTTGTQVGEGRILDLTTPGCLIESPLAVQKAQPLHLEMFLPGIASPLIVTLAVIRWTEGNRFGAEFIKMHTSQQQILQRFMVKHYSEGLCM